MQKIVFKRIKKLDSEWVFSKVKNFIAEDAPFGDLTTQAIIPDTVSSRAQMVANDSFTFCGEQFIPFCFPDCCTVDLFVKDGSIIFPETILAEITGPASTILTYERVVLNLSQRLCGISTETYKYSKLKVPENFKIMDTRKTTPGLRLFEKYAVSVGGCWNHRLDLSSAILVKDNHIQAAGSIKKAIQSIREKYNNKHPIELEVDNLAQLRVGLDLEVDGFLLDNMNPQTVKKAVAIIRSAKDGDKVFIEASGGINYSTLEQFAWTGIDAVSMSSITSNAKPVDIKMEFI